MKLDFNPHQAIRHLNANYAALRESSRDAEEAMMRLIGAWQQATARLRRKKRRLPYREFRETRHL